MSFCIYHGMNNHVDIGYKKFGSFQIKTVERTTPSPMYVLEKENVLILTIGEFSNNNIDEIISDNWEDDPLGKLPINDAFCILKVDLNCDKVYFLSSKSGIEHFLYYKKEDTFIITDDFWEAVNLIDPTYEDIDSQNLYETILHFYPIFDGTMIKNLFWLKPSSYGFFDLNEKELLIKEYWEFKYTFKKEYTLDEAIEKLDSILNDAMVKIKEKCGDVQYSVGLSGGLDSRIIPYYALRNGLRLNAFIIGKSRPRKIFLSRDHKSSSQLAKYYKIPLKFVEDDSESLKIQLMNDIATYPLGDNQVFKLAMKELPQFDVLLHGGNGAVVGATIPSNLMKMSNEELADFLEHRYSTIKEISFFKNRVSRALKYLFGISYEPKGKEVSCKESIIPLKNQFVFKSKLLDFINVKKKSGLTNADVHGYYANYYLGCRNRFGAFESMGGRKKAFSIWNPYALEETLSWPMDFFLDRKILSELVKRKIPEISRIKEQSFKVASGKTKINLFNKVYVMIEFVLRGRALSEQRYQRPIFKKLFFKVMNKETTWFYRIVPIKNNLINILREQPWLSGSIVKQKVILDLIETKEYKDFLERSK